MFLTRRFVFAAALPMAFAAARTYAALPAAAVPGSAAAAAERLRALVPAPDR
jgi:hypothetical protein